MQDKHRLAQIVDGLKTTFDTLKQDTATSGLSIKAYVVIKKYEHWTALETLSRQLRTPVFPALMLNFASGGQRIKGGEAARFASLGQTEDVQNFVLIGILKETDDTPDVITDQVSNLITSVEQLINGTNDLGVEGVCAVEITSPPETSEGRASAVAGTAMEICVFRISVTHIYRASTFP